MKNPLKRWDVFATLIVLLAAIPAERFEVLSFLEDQTVSFRHILRANYGDPAETRLREEIVLVSLDETLYAKYGSFPFRRTDIGRLAEIVASLGARVVALDFLMDFPSSYDEDGPTVEMLRTAENVLLVSTASFDGEVYNGLTYPTETLRAVSRSGYSNLEPTSAIVDNLARLRVHPQITLDKDGWPFAIQALALYWGVEPSLDGNMLTIGEVTVPLDQSNDMYIDFPQLDPGTQYLSMG